MDQTTNTTKSFISANKWLILLFILSLAANTVVFLMFRAKDPGFGATSFKGDAKGYVALAENLISEKFSVFSMSPGQPFEPDTLRTPGYPVFIAFVKMFFRTYLFVIFLQFLMSFACAWLIFEIGKKLFSPVVGFFLGLLFLLDPLTIYSNLGIMSDVIFTLIFIFTIYFLLVRPVIEEKFFSSIWPYFLSGLSLGICVLIRPFALYLAPAIVVLFALVNYARLGFRKTFIAVCAISLATGVTIIPWMLRNLQETGKFELSSIGSYHLYWSLGPEFVSWKYKINQQSARQMFEAEAEKKYGEKLSVFDPRWKPVVMGVLARDASTYLVFHGVKTLPFFLSSPYKALALAVAPGQVKYESFNLTSALFSGDFTGVLNSLKNDLPETIDNLIRLAMLGFALLSVFNKKFRPMSIALLCMTAFIALMCVPISNVRYRLPVQPFLLVLDAIGIQVVWGWFSKISHAKGKLQIPKP